MNFLELAEIAHDKESALRFLQQHGIVQTERRCSKQHIMTDTSAETLLPVIRNIILPGTTVMSDKWSAYQNLGQLPASFTRL